MAKYQQYEEYKDSHLNYYGLIPGHWFLEKIKYNSYVKGRQGWQNLRSEEYQDEGPYLVTGAHFDQKGGVSWELCHHISEERYDRDSDIWIEERDVLVTKDGTIGKVAFINNLPYKACLNSHLLIIRNLFNSYDQRFLFHLLSSSCFKGFIPTRQTGTTFMGITQAAIEEFPLLLPPADEQSKIASFLDHETAQIDTLIEKQQTLIQLLKEKRQAVISHAVTKGLNPDALMKESGVEWLGDVPEHWEVGRLKNVLRIRNGRDYKEVEVESGGYPVYGSGGIFKRSSDYLFDGESVLFGRKGTVDKPLLVSGKFWTVDTMFYSEVFSNAKPNYIYHQALLFPFDQLSTNTALPSMTQENLLELGFVIPPFDEQEQICQYLSNKLKVFSNLVSKAEQAIQLMQERRTALISAAVTGKIDVRGWRAPE